MLKVIKEYLGNKEAYVGPRHCIPKNQHCLRQAVEQFLFETASKRTKAIPASPQLYGKITYLDDVLHRI